MKVVKILNKCLGGGFNHLGRIPAFFMAGILFLFTACENFLNGSYLFENLEKQMDYANAPYASVTIASIGTETASLIPPAGSYSSSYKAGDSINLKFEPQVGYRFVKWIATPGDAVLFVDENSDSTNAKILSSENPIIIQPYVVLKDKLIINFKCENGSIVPTEQKSLYLDEEFSLNYREDSGYAFVGWKITDDLTKKDVTDALKLIGTGNSVTAKVLDTNKKITVQALSVKRPNIVGTTPTYTSEGVYRDMRVMIMFDDFMDESSIYYSKEELVALEILGANESYENLDFNTETLDSGYKLLLTTVNNVKKCYGYQIPNDNNSVVFKNIKITNRKNRNANYLANYLAPYFDENDSSILRIDADLTAPPPSATDILIIINKEMCNSVDGTSISLPSDYSWVYYTNGNTDKNAPNFVDFSVQFANDNQTNYNDSNAVVNSDADFFNQAENDINFAIENFPSNNLRTKQIWVKGGFSDSGSGPAALKWSLKKLNSKYYPGTDNEVMFGQIDIELPGGQNATIKNDGVRIDLDNMVAEGCYQLDFTCSDKNGWTKTNSYYFVYDVVPPNASTLNYVSTQAKDAVTVQKSGNDTFDYYYSEVNEVKLTANVDKAFTGLGADSRKHTFVIKDYDLVGNCRTTTQEIVSKPSVGMIYYSDGYWSSDYDAAHKPPEGAICKVDSDSKFYIWDIWDQYGYCWGVPDIKITTEYDSGIQVYDELMKQFGEVSMKKNGFSRKQTSIETENSPSMWTYVIDKNKETKPADVSSEKWFIPSLDEMYYVFNNLEKLETSFNKISAGYGHTEREKIYKFAYRQVQLIQYSNCIFYWTCTLHNVYRYHGCPVAFNSDIYELYESFYGLSDWGNTWHSYKGRGFRMGLARINNNSHSDNYIMDRCIRNCNDKQNSMGADWSAWDMKTHAMALVEMK